MKKSIYLLTILFSLVNCSCASLFSNASGVCNCTCEVCKDCKNKHKHVLSPEELAQYEAEQSAKKAEEARRDAELDSLLNMDYSLVKYTIPDLEPYKWEDNESTVFENSTNHKWYGLIMPISKSKLDNKTNKIVEVINIKLDPNEILELLKRKGFYKAYHMNKKYWITIILDNTLSTEEIMNLIDKSYNLVKPKK